MKKIVIGLTGPTGSGKSSACEVAKDMGFKIVDCDALARVAVEKGSCGLKAVVSAFGIDILNEDGTLNRKALAEKAFSSKENTKLLNDTIFPFIKELVVAETIGDKVLLDAPTLYESGIDSMCCDVIAVLSNEEIRLDRIIRRDSLDSASAKLRISAGKPDEYYIKKTDNIIYNNADKSDFKTQFEVIINKILKENCNG